MTRDDISRKANELRKAGDIPAAKELYIELWQESQDKFTAAGLLHCYRKLEEFDNALALTDEIKTKYPNFNWVSIECIWTLIQGRLNKLEEDVDTFTVVSIAEQILILKPEFIALKAIVFKVIKTAKKNRDWEILLDWLHKIDPEQLQNDSELKKDWSDKEIWYYYKVVGLTKMGSFSDAIDLIEKKSSLFPTKLKFFEREKAKAQIALENFSEGEKIYSQLVASQNADWWLLHEYAVIHLKNGRSDEAIKLFCKAALSSSPLPHKVTLLKNIGEFALTAGKLEEALAHFKLIEKIRLEQGWGVPNTLNSTIQDLSEQASMNFDELSISELLKKCKPYWNSYLDEGDRLPEVGKTKGLKGKLKLGDQAKQFCFIETKENSYFCSKDDLPNGVKDGQLVQFDLKESFDKKKNKKSWKAIRVRTAR